MFAKIALFELRYQLRNPVFWVATVIFFLLTYGAMASDDITIGGGGNVNANSPVAIVTTHMILTLFFMFVTTAFVANVIVRDEESEAVVGDIARKPSVADSHAQAGARRPVRILDDFETGITGGLACDPPFVFAAARDSDSARTAQHRLDCLVDVIKPLPVAVILGRKRVGIAPLETCDLVAGSDAGAYCGTVAGHCLHREIALLPEGLAHRVGVRPPAHVA